MSLLRGPSRGCARVWELEVGEDPEKGKPIVTLNKSFMMEVNVGQTLSPTGKVETSRHVLFSLRKTVRRGTVFMLMDPEMT